MRLRLPTDRTQLSQIADFAALSVEPSIPSPTAEQSRDVPGNDQDHNDGKTILPGTEEIETDLLLSSIGYRSFRIPGLPYDERRGLLPSREGRVLDVQPKHDGEKRAGLEEEEEEAEEEERVIPGVYVSGWAKRGSTGIVGTNIGDAKQTVQSLLQDFQNGGLKTFPRRKTQHDDPTLDGNVLPTVVEEEDDLLLQHLQKLGLGDKVVSQAEWTRIDEFERRIGAELQKPREKILSAEQMLEIGKQEKKKKNGNSGERSE